MKYTQETFIKRANEVHNNHYDYSKTKYVDSQTEIVIICPKHGEFLQRPSRHLAGSGCRRCGVERRKQTNLQRYGSESWAASNCAKDLAAQGQGPWSSDARKKAATTCVERFGAKTWAESDIGIATAKANCADEETRKKMSERAKSEITRQHYAETSKAHCGAEHWTQSDNGKQRLHKMFSTDEERHARSERMLSSDTKAKMQKTSIEKYGVPYYWQSDDARKRLKKLLNQKDVQDKIIETKKKRGTINSSKPEREAYEMLVKKFGSSDVECQYRTDDRYPFACDFYIKSLDLFIELNISWLHCGHWFDENDESDLLKLRELQNKVSDVKPMYGREIYIWTYDDLRKRDTAVKNQLNYLVFWDYDLNDFKLWLDSI